MLFARALVLPMVALFCSGQVEAQIFSKQEIGGKVVECMRSGLTSTYKDCGSHSDWYSYVFVGRITSIAPSKDDESEVQIIPEEIFLGKPEAALTVFTSQGLCLPKLTIGDRWLFYLRKTEGKPIVLDYYGNDSIPVAEAKSQIETFRRLRSIGNFAILRGKVVRGQSFEGNALPGAEVLAERQSDKRPFTAITDSDGQYEFQPLPPGKYALRVAPIGTYKPDDSEVDLHGGSCRDLTLDRSPHARIAGRVNRPNGRPVVNLGVVLISSDSAWYMVTQTDESGRFSFDEETAGEYVVGVNSPASPDWFSGSGAGAGVKLPPASLFYSSATRRSEARVIKLQPDEQVDNIDFVVATD